MTSRMDVAMRIHPLFWISPDCPYYESCEDGPNESTYDEDGDIPFRRSLPKLLAQLHRFDTSRLGNLIVCTAPPCPWTEGKR